ncbi:MAG: nickel-responsive transcriptional regulator NikR [Candidatus Aminicenantes bacterium]|nr:nickel-responsive transcriptional regulator NikR [Candidatus Aminicenantes bacterium]
MSDLIRFGVSLEKGLLEKFDKYIRRRKWASRSDALRDLIRAELIKKEWTEGDEVAGAVTLIYDHHRKDLLGRLTDLQHGYQRLVLSTLHIHLDHDHCLEIIAVKGEPAEIQKLAETLRTIQGVKHGTLTMSATGRNLD